MTEKEMLSFGMPGQPRRFPVVEAMISLVGPLYIAHLSVSNALADGLTHQPSTEHAPDNLNGNIIVGVILALAVIALLFFIINTGRKDKMDKKKEDNIPPQRP